jgi:uncharacterized protein YycO
MTDMTAKKIERARFWFFAVAAVILSGSVLLLNRHLFSQADQTAVYSYLRSALHGVVGSGYGAFSGPAPDIEFRPGDILLGGWPNCAYGRYGHAGLFIGDGQVLEGYADYGITVQSVDHYRNYAYFGVLRVDASESAREAAIAYARRQLYEIFHPLAFKNGDRYWNCTKIIWKAYAENGVELDVLNDVWITPDALRDSPIVTILYER